MISWFVFFLSDEVEKLTSRTITDVTHLPVQGENQFSTCDTPSVAEGALFAAKRFLLLGFGEEDKSCIADLIREHAGKVLPLQSRTIADYAVVPLLGCAVKATVGDVVTNTWLVRGSRCPFPQGWTAFSQQRVTEGAH